MMVRKMLMLTVLFFLASAVLFAGGAIEATANGGTSWDVDIDYTDLIGGAGTNFNTSIESAANLIDIDITFVWYTNSWYVTVQKTDTVWDSDIQVYIRRTGDGTGSGSISGGGTYILITDTAQEFFRVARTRSNIPAQMRLNGFSVPLMNSGTYTTSIVYTLTQTF